MHLIKRPGRSPYWIVRFPDPDGSGRTIQKSTGEVAERAARKRAQEIVDGFRTAYELTRKGGQITALGVAMQFWESELSKRRSAATAEVHLKRIVTHLGNERPYCEVTTADVAAFRDTLDAEGSLSVATINRALEVWRRMHHHARDIREYPVKPIKFNALMRQEPAGRTRHLSPEELAKILEQLPESAQEIVLFGVSTGARKAQVLGLEWDRVDLAHKTATIFLKSRRQYVRHLVDLNPTAMKVIQRRVRHGTEGLVFDTRNFRKLWEAALKRAGIEDFRFHDLRHTFASLAARRTSLAVVQKLLGHSSITTTNRYAHVQREDLRAAVYQLPEMRLIEKGE